MRHEFNLPSAPEYPRDDDRGFDPAAIATCPTCGGDGDRKNPEGACIRCHGAGLLCPEDLTAAERAELDEVPA